MNKKMIKKENPSVDDQRNELSAILPIASSGTTFTSVQFGETTIRFPIPISRDLVKKANLQNRTVFQIGPFKIGIDIV